MILAYRLFQELELCKDTDEIFKQVGTVLFPQNRDESIQILAKQEAHIKAELSALLNPQVNRFHSFIPGSVSIK
jgi:chaperonin cofactor prefoldin